ncbi:MAG: site-specific DNA-methyltransferase [Spirochaetales bacterium]|nr:site-specific DNA-methyltransferase [Spirochaetales bacterium]
MKPLGIPRLDKPGEFHDRVLACCRLKPGEIWTDPVNGHRVGVTDATDAGAVHSLCENETPTLMIHDPPYNIAVGRSTTDALSVRGLSEYIDWCRRWVSSSLDVAAQNAYLYVWTGADQQRGFQPLPDFMVMMRDFKQWQARCFITMRNQRGYGTQRNWMFVRQELLCYAKGDPGFTVEYTDIPKILRGYYKKVGGELKENLERGKANTIRPGNVWVDIQQVFYRMEENVPGAYAQKPLKAIRRIISSSSAPADTVADFFSHSGTTLLAAELSGRKCITCDIDPVFAELTIRRLEHYRKTGKTGWQTENPFPEVPESHLPRAR